MNSRLMICVIPLFLSALILTADAADVNITEVVKQQEEALDLDDLERAAERAGGVAEYGASLDEGLTALLEKGNEAAGGIVREAIRSAVLLMVVMLFCGFGESVCEVAGTRTISVISVVGTLAIGAVSAADVDSMLGLGRSVVENTAEFANVLLPVMAAITAATGAAAGAAVRQMTAVVFSDLLVNLINGLLIPIVYGYLAVAVAYAALGNEGLKRIGGLLKWSATTLLTTVMLAFVGYLSVSGVVAGSTDAMTVKAAKFAISGSIPVVGGILSDAAETILASAGVLRSTVGVFGMVTILGLCMLPLLRIAIHYLMYKLVAAVSGTVGPARISELVEQISGAFGLMLGMTGACCLLLLVSLVSSITAVSV